MCLCAGLQMGGLKVHFNQKSNGQLEMLTKAQSDGRPAEYRWRLCSTPQSLDHAHYWSAVQYRCQDAKPVEICRGAPSW